MSLKLPRLQAALPIVDSQGRPIASFLRWWQSIASAGEDNASLSDPSYVTIASSTLLVNERSLLAGGGLTLTDAGPGLTVSFAVGAGTGITVNADDVALDTTSTRNTDHSAVTFTAGAGLTGGGDLTANRSFAVGAGTGITVNADDVSLTTMTAAGTYTPTLTNVANLDASTAYTCQYLRVGNTITVSGKVAIDPTTPATSTQLGISLPVASNFANSEECGGTAFAPSISGQGAAIFADVTNNRAQLQLVSGDITNQDMYFSFTYLVI